MSEFERDKKGFNEKEVEQCLLLQHRIMKCLREYNNDVGFSVLLTILLKSVTNEHNKKEDFMDSISKSWDQHMEYKEEK